jgi:uncharacterized protein (DUF58 family)
MELLPSRRLLLLLAGASLLFLVHPLAALIVDALLLLAFALDAATARRHTPLVERQVPARLPLGAAADVALHVRSRARWPARIRLTDDLPAALAREGDELHERVLEPGDETRVGYRVRATRRGDHALGSVHWRMLGPLGLAWWGGREAAPAMLRVFPGGLEVQQFRLLGLRHRLHELGLRNVRKRGEGGVFESLREYARGDDPRTIDWKASARRGTPIVRQYEAERNQNLVVAIDAGRLMTQEIGGRARLDHALSAALLLADVASRYGDRVGLLVFADRVQQFLPPARVSLPRLADTLSQVEAQMVEPNYPAAFALLNRQLRRRSLLILFTDVGDALVSAPLIDHLCRVARRHLPLVVALRNSEVELAAAGTVHDDAGAFRRAAAEELLSGRAQALGTLQRSGVLVADARPEEATPAVVSRYLEVKAKGLL